MVLRLRTRPGHRVVSTGNESASDLRFRQDSDRLGPLREEKRVKEGEGMRLQKMATQTTLLPRGLGRDVPWESMSLFPGPDPPTPRVSGGRVPDGREQESYCCFGPGPRGRTERSGGSLRRHVGRRGSRERPNQRYTGEVGGRLLWGERRKT